jgi:hypothetical protein
MLVKADADSAAAGVAKLIGGNVQTKAYGKSFVPGKRSFVLVQPSGMRWSNLLQLAPPRKWPEDSKKAQAFGTEIARACGTSVLWIGYSDAGDAAEVIRCEPDGSTMRDDGWDREMLAEVVSELGDAAPAELKRRLEAWDEDAEDPSSTQRLTQLAQAEKFVVAAFGLDCPRGGGEVEIAFAGLPEQAFDAVAYVST